MINPKLIMLIITDITEKLQLEAQVAEEQTRLRLIVTAATESAELFEVLDDYRKFGRQDLPRLLAAVDHPEPALAEIYRQVHTFKGLFGQMEFIYLPDALHEFESELRQYKESATARPNPDELVGRLQQADAALERDLAILRDTLGESFFARRGRLELAPEDVAMLEQLADRLLHGKGQSLDSVDTRALLQRLKRLRYVPFGHLLSGYAKAAVRLAQRREKELAPVGIEDNGLRVPPEVYAPFAKSLVHLFRNAVDHGIETPEERWELDKEEEGHINCRAWAEGDGIVLEIADDGRGLDVEAIRRKAVEKGLLAAEAPGLEPEELYRLIFTDEFSTKQTADAMSGRGVGLAAVRMETQRLGGEIEVESTPGAGTIFRFRLPYLEKPLPNTITEEIDERP
ncbi:ATP-binding protein [Desulfurivibrio sp. D14AmB]|uniref:ATP-binding protein n=1 Tax=Desulfurivibrio sp. D14AmB TaxID=3374370 RepID=UPI00376EAA85